MQFQSMYDRSPRVIAQAKLAGRLSSRPVQRKQNRTGLPDTLKAGIESLSGMSLDDVQVHYNSSRPAQLQALAYAQGTDIHLAPGQERNLPHEAWHVVQQAQGRVSPTTEAQGFDVNDEPALEAEADRMGARAAATRLEDGSAPLQRVSSAGDTVQRSVILGREPTSWYHLFSGSTMKRLLSMDDHEEVLGQVMEFLRGLPDEPTPQDGVSPRNVAVWKGLKGHALARKDLIKRTLARWIGAHSTVVASTTGVDERAEWKEFENIEELALALAHETHPQYQKNVAYEGQLADLVNNDDWVRAQLESLRQKVDQYMGMEVSSFRQLVEPLERRLVGSYSWQKTVTSLFSMFKDTDKREPTGAISENKRVITEQITFLHDLMERWSSSGAGSMAAKVHETLGVVPVLPDAPDKAFETTMLDEDRSEFTGDQPPRVRHYRATKKVDQEERDEVLLDLTIKRAIRAAEKSLAAIDRIGRLQKAVKAATTSEERESLEQEIAELQGKIESRKARLAFEGLGQLSFNDNQTPQQTVEGRAEEGQKLPPYGMIASYLKAQQQERAKDKLKRVTVGAVDKSSKAKGRRNVGTRLENNPDTLLARLMSAPITAGRSMTTARMLQLVERVGGSDAEKTAVAYALFAYWARTYNQGLTPVHTFHETLDVAQNFGVPYKAFHYPTAVDGALDLMTPGRFVPMSEVAKDAVPDEEWDASEAGFEQMRRWDTFRGLLDTVPRAIRLGGREDGHARDEVDLDVMHVGSEPAKKQEGDSDSIRRDIPGSRFTLTRNEGGGDCLFHALEGRDLDPTEVLDLRRQIADVRRQMPQDRDNINAWNMIAALHQTPRTTTSAHRLMADRDEVPNDVYAAMQEVPGIYAGDDELVQYCQAKGVSVAVVSWNGELQIADGNGIQSVHYDEGGQEEALNQALTSTDLALYKSPGHWERIEE
ncbi:hypothetical protein MFUL124B02_23370 [Myxococcus fulvus 124B02]|nr:hypothetical protein MFUL124B02_23370 [Myxococcus fulvus 124B02]